MRRPGQHLDVAVDGFRGRVLVREDGPADAPAVLLVHGFCGSNTWFDEVTERLRGEFRVVRYDLLGHGGTGGPAADAPLQTRVASALLAALDLHDVTAVGHSFGADVAAGLAEAEARVARTVIVAQAPDYTDAHFPPGAVLMTHAVTAGLLHGAGRLGALGLGGALRVRPPRDPRARRLAPLALADFRALDTAMFRVVLKQRGERLAARPLDAQLRDSGKPALVLLGQKDHFYGDRSAPRYRAVGAAVEIVPEAGHSLQIERPGLVASKIGEFAGAHSGTTTA